MNEEELTSGEREFIARAKDFFVEYAWEKRWYGDWEIHECNINPNSVTLVIELDMSKPYWITSFSDCPFEIGVKLTKENSVLLGFTIRRFQLVEEEND